MAFVVEVHPALGDVGRIGLLALPGLLVGDEIEAREDREADGAPH